MPTFTHCVDCGAEKPWHWHPSRRRCLDCDKANKKRLAKARAEAIRSGTHTPRVMHGELFRDKNQIAYALMNRAIAYGFLLPASEYDCVDCGEKADCYDHRDYNKPLDVVPVCVRCNNLRGPGIPMQLPVKPADRNPA